MRLVLNVPGVGLVKIGQPSGLVVANHWPWGPKVPMILGSPFTTQYWPFTPHPKFESRPTPVVVGVFVKSVALATLQGNPVWNCVTPLICHPPRSLPVSFVRSLNNGKL